jgi:hypothetical protein
MTPQQLRDYSAVLGPAGCGFRLWRYDDVYFAKTANKDALADVAADLAGVTAPACRRT